jgi:hypothetical protein
MCWSETALGALDVFLHFKFHSHLNVSCVIAPYCAIVVSKMTTMEGSSLFNSSITTLSTNI